MPGISRPLDTPSHCLGAMSDKDRKDYCTSEQKTESVGRTTSLDENDFQSTTFDDQEVSELEMLAEKEESRSLELEVRMDTARDLRIVAPRDDNLLGFRFSGLLGVLCCNSRTSDLEASSPFPITLARAQQNSTVGRVILDASGGFLNDLHTAVHKQFGIPPHLQVLSSEVMCDKGFPEVQNPGQFYFVNADGHTELSAWPIPMLDATWRYSFDVPGTVLSLRSLDQAWHWAELNGEVKDGQYCEFADLACLVEPWKPRHWKKAYSVGDVVECFSNGMHSWDAATVEKVNDNGTLTLRCENHSDEEPIKSASDIRWPAEQTFEVWGTGVIKVLRSFPKTPGQLLDFLRGKQTGMRPKVQSFQIGDQVDALHSSGNWYAATVKSVNWNGTYTLCWEDGEPSERIKGPRSIRLRGNLQKGLDHPAVVCPTPKQKEPWLGLTEAPWSVWDDIDGLRVVGPEHLQSFKRITYKDGGPSLATCKRALRALVGLSPDATDIEVQSRVTGCTFYTQVRNADDALRFFDNCGSLVICADAQRSTIAFAFASDDKQVLDDDGFLFSDEEGVL